MAKIRVFDPKGRSGFIPESQLEDALAQGFTMPEDFTPPQISGRPTLDPTRRGPDMAAEDVLPTLGGVGGGLLGATGGLITGVAGATVGGQVGATARNYVRAVRGKSVPETALESLKESGLEGLKQGAGELIGAGTVPALKFLGRRVGDVGGLLTGTGGALRKAAEAGLEGGKAQKALISTLRGDVTERQAVGDAMDSLQVIKRARSKEYVKQMEKIQAENFQKKIDFNPIKQKLDDLLNDYNIVRTKKGKLDFSRATLDDPSIIDVKRMAELVDGWGSKPGDFTVKGLDVLKRRIDDFYSPSGEARAFVSSLRNEVKDSIVDAVPAYEKMTRKYERASEAIKDISSELSMGANAKAGTVMRKLKQTLRQNFDLRKEFVETLDKAGKKNVMEQIAGVELNPITPKGLMRAVAGAGALTAPFTNPALLAALPFTSPRLMGETALKVGQAARLASPARRLVTPSVQAGIGLKRLGLFDRDEE